MSEFINQQLSAKVNSQTLDTIYNNFVKITDWILKGDKSQYKVPDGAFLNTIIASANNAQELANAVKDIANLISSLQSRVNAAEQKNVILESKLGALITKVERLEAVDKEAEVIPVVQAQPQVAVPIADTEVTMVQVTTASTSPLGETDMTLADLGSPIVVGNDTMQVAVEQPVDNTSVVSKQQVQPSVVQTAQTVVQSTPVVDQADPVMVSAKAVDAGDIDPNAHKNLHAEVLGLLGKLQSE